MALVKTTKISPTPAKGGQAAERGIKTANSKKAVILPVTAGKGVQKDKVAERIAAATEELASGLTEAAAAAEELRRSMEQIAAGADEAAGASQEQLAAIKNVTANLTIARNEADSSRRKTEATQMLLTEAAAQISASVQAIEKNAERQMASAKIIGELERRAQDVSTITATVSRISDQTNLLALNAAIEAARAGDHGRGFAVVAEEVRKLAEESGDSATTIAELVKEIQQGIDRVVALVQQAAQLADDGVESSGRAQVAFADIGDAIAGISESVDGMTETSTEIATVAEQSSASAQQMTSATQETSAQSRELRTSLSELASTADRLLEASRQFSLTD